MINIQKLIEEAAENGYTGDKATAKTCQDIVLKALATGPLKKKVTIKGDVVMRSKTNNVRRATQDLDIDFIRYSLADESIDAFIANLNCMEGITITRSGRIEELKQQDYSGKRVFVLIEDAEGHRVKSKIDLGVHNRFELEQEEYCFDIAYDDEGASLLINSNEQMFVEKLRSLLKFGPFSTRYKDVYDMYYLKDHLDKNKLSTALAVYIFDDPAMRENEITDIVKRLKFTFHDKMFMKSLDKSDKRWLDDTIEEITTELSDFLSALS
ncbi:MAG: nucleotidyl transferase AbiEii/AbiGii toxin family protein [Lachnospiraceae bacterium]|nr:nucleotidyl transferase AbiEii/AbiGii toxin family protein [Lachnospiraceae bacterium]